MNTSFTRRATTAFLLLFIFKGVAAQLQIASEVHLSYPKARDDKSFYVFLGRKNMGKIEYGQRMIYRFYSEGNLKVTILPKSNFIEPKTISANSRTITLKPDASFYFEINGKGELTYIPDPAKGKDFFEKKNYSSSPVKYDIAAADSLVSK